MNDGCGYYRLDEVNGWIDGEHVIFSYYEENVRLIKK